jgi:hypothetical protein
LAAMRIVAKSSGYTTASASTPATPPDRRRVPRYDQGCVSGSAAGSALCGASVPGRTSVPVDKVVQQCMGTSIEFVVQLIKC